MAGKNSVFVNNSPPSADSTWLNLNQQEQNNLITGTGQSLSDAINNQQAISASRFAGNNFYIDSGAADAYVLTLASSMTNPVSATVGYYVGMTIRFRAGNANTGACTVNINSAGVKNIKLADGSTNPPAGAISTTQDIILRYNGTSFVIMGAIGSVSTFLQTPSSANLAAALTDESGSGVVQFGGASWTTFTPTFTGFSANPTVDARYLKIGKVCFVEIYSSGAGTSNAQTLTITNLPFTSGGGTMTVPCFVVDNGTGAFGMASVSSSSTTLQIFKGASLGGNTFTSSGAKYVNISFFYETAS